MSSNHYSRIVGLVVTTVILAAWGAYSPAAADWGENWTATYNWQGASQDTAFAIAIGPDGNAVVTGPSYFLEVNGYYFSWRNARFTTAKYDAAGQLLWVAQYHYDNEGNHMPEAQVMDAEGNVVVVGGSWNGENDYDFATVKYNPDGEQLWAARWAGPAYDDVPHAAAIDGAGDVYVSGASSDDVYGNNMEAVTVKYDPDGNELWVQKYPDNNYYIDAGSVIAVTQAGEAYVGIPGAIILKRDTDGALLWNAQRPAEEVCALKLDGDGNLLVGGDKSGGGAGFLAKYTAAGDLIWNREFPAVQRSGPTRGAGCGYVFDMAVDGDNNTYLTAAGDFVAKYDADGQQVWRATDDSFAPRALFVDQAENLSAAGNFITGAVDNPLDDYLAVARYDADGNVLETASHVSAYGSDAADLAVDSAGRAWAAGGLCVFGVNNVPHMPPCWTWDFLIVQLGDSASPDDDLVPDDDAAPDDDATADDDAADDDAQNSPAPDNGSSSVTGCGC
jgi:hypothetical protein